MVISMQSPFQQTVSVLREFGLKDNDINVYLACLKASEGLFVKELVDRTNLKRSTIDLVIERLLEKDYLAKVKMGARYRYKSIAPESILFAREKTLDDFKKLVPLLSNLQTDDEETDIRFFDSKEGVRQGYRQVLLSLRLETDPAKKELLAISSGNDVMRSFPDIYDFFISKRIKEKLSIKIITSQTNKKQKGWDDDISELREVKYFDEKRFPFNVSFEVFSDSVWIFSPHQPIGGVLIKNEKISSSLRSLHQLLWSLL